MGRKELLAALILILSPCFAQASQTVKGSLSVETTIEAGGAITGSNLSGTNTGDQTLPTRDSLGLDTDDTVTFANLSGTNTGDQDLSGYALLDGSNQPFTGNVTVANYPEPTYGSGGNTITDIVVGDVTYRVHQFTSTGSGTFVAPSPARNVEVLVVAGGGTGGSDKGGGGGGGQVVYNSAYATTAGQSISLTVGAAGTNSTFGTITAIKGSNASGRVGGASGSGYAGGSNVANSGGGGGGDSAVGQNSYVSGSDHGGDGGNGTSSTITGTSICFGGGGGGGTHNVGYIGYGVCGGGRGGKDPNNGVAGTANRGGGGGGGGGGNTQGGAGGSGIVIVRYPVTVGAAPVISLQEADATKWSITSDGNDSSKLKINDAAGNTQATIDQTTGDAEFNGDLTADNLSGTNTGDQDVSGLVPYSGASSDVDLGSHDITLNGTGTMNAIVSNYHSGDNVYNNPTFFQPVAGDPNWAFGSVSDDNTGLYAMQATYFDIGDGLRGFRVQDYYTGNIPFFTSLSHTEIPYGYLKIGSNTNDSGLKVGALEFQGYTKNNNWFGDNIFFNGSNFQLRDDGYAGMFYFQFGEGQFRYFPSGYAGSDPGTSGNYVQMKTSNTGKWGVGGATGSAIATATDDFTGSQIYKDADGRFYVGSTTNVNGAKVQVHSDSTTNGYDYPFALFDDAYGGGAFKFTTITGGGGPLPSGSGDVIIENGVGNMLFSPNASGKSVFFNADGWNTTPAQLTVATGGNVLINQTDGGYGKLQITGASGVSGLIVNGGSGFFDGPSAFTSTVDIANNGENNNALAVHGEVLFGSGTFTDPAPGEAYDLKMGGSGAGAIATLGKIVSDTGMGIGTIDPARGFHQYWDGTGGDPMGKFMVESTSGSWGQFQIVNPTDGEVTLVLASNSSVNSDGTMTSLDANGEHIWAYGLGSYGTLSTDFSFGNNGLGGPALSIRGGGGIEVFGGVEATSYSANGSPGVTASGTTCTITAITNGIITGATCTP